VASQTRTVAPNTGDFGSSSVYKAVVTLTAQSGYTFTGIAANAFSYAGASSVASSASSGTVTITFPPTAAAQPVNAFNLSSLFTAPVAGASPVTSAINQTQYTGTVAWQTSSGASHSGAFGYSSVYKAVVTLTAQSGYTFTGVAANAFSYAGASSVANSANSRTVTITFPPTAAQPVNAFNLSSLVTAPVAGASPVTTAINTAQYTGTVAWQTNSGSAYTGNFGYSSVYRAVVTLTAQSGYTFTGVAANAFSYAGASGVASSANSGTVTITFPATANQTGTGVFTYYWLNEQGGISFTNGASATISRSENLTISAQGSGYSNQAWFINGVEDAARAGQSSYTFNGAIRTAGKYTVGLRVAKGGAYYYAELTVTVRN
jgi:hypothetical protein